jgi:hypothetical protein
VTHAARTVLNDVELFSVLRVESSVAILDFISSSLGFLIDAEALDSAGVEAIIRSGLHQRIAIAVFPILAKLSLNN